MGPNTVWITPATSERMIQIVNTANNTNITGVILASENLNEAELANANVQFVLRIDEPDMVDL